MHHGRFARRTQVQRHAVQSVLAVEEDVHVGFELRHRNPRTGQVDPAIDVELRLRFQTAPVACQIDALQQFFFQQHQLRIVQPTGSYHELYGLQVARMGLIEAGERQPPRCQWQPSGTTTKTDECTHGIGPSDTGHEGAHAEIALFDEVGNQQRAAGSMQLPIEIVQMLLAGEGRREVAAGQMRLYHASHDLHLQRGVETVVDAIDVLGLFQRGDRFVEALLAQEGVTE